MNFVSFNILDNDVEDTVYVNSIKLSKDMFSPFLLSAILMFISSVFLLFIYRVVIIKHKEVYYKKVEVENYRDEQGARILNYIKENFNDPEISIESIKSNTGIYEKQITSVIKSSTKLTFKQYLNKIRIDEAKRLLLESDRNISEIASLVGYNSSPHFSRVFKELTSKSPKEFRKKNIT